MGDLTMPAAAVPVVDDLVSIVIPATVADPLAMTPAGANSRVDRTIDAYAGQIAGWSISDEQHEDDRTVEKMFEEQGRAEKEMSYAE